MIYGTAKRQAAWEHINRDWDLIIIGGGITGAGILREAVRVGLNVLLLEQNDFASGTSSRSSKLVHGGLRYLNNFQFNLTWQSVTERETLLKEGVGLVRRLPFLYPIYKNAKMPGWMLEFGLYMYGWMTGKFRIHEDYAPQDLQMMSPGLTSKCLTGGFRFYDAQTDDARLVLRVIREGVQVGTSVEHPGDALALNYARVEKLLYDPDGLVNGVQVRDRLSDQVLEVNAAAVVNATGAWADQLRSEVGAEPAIRPLRGSHLVFKPERFPVYQAVSFAHPDDGRWVFVFPWEGVTLLGTTDLDHHADLDEEPAISPAEIDYLLRAVQHQFPAFNLSKDDIISTFAGIRPVISTDPELEPSKESREHAIWHENGLLTVTGGKLTTFRLIALDVLKALRRQLPEMVTADTHLNALDRTPYIEAPPKSLTCEQATRLVARYGAEILEFYEEMPDVDRAQVNGLPIHWLEFRWAAREEGVIHLDDLLLRRVRIGLLAPDGGEKYLPRIRELVQAELGWNDVRWQQEEQTYLLRWKKYYGTPAHIQSTESAIAL